MSFAVLAQQPPPASVRPARFRRDVTEDETPPFARGLDLPAIAADALGRVRFARVWWTRRCQERVRRIERLNARLAVNPRAVTQDEVEVLLNPLRGL
jgi:hypothetical protein